ncbi:hypothetical protein M3B43_07460 [Nesterenkonia massiliensis]|uniref:Phage head morphogenesis domain-containing protein n=1 Tax=Nesterenkonia massiliensis TaxID=1232429 RepID=A0ABT2HR44_9MICC|nr:hypothetical protein [Nesterenkonia massiliensis]MCT1607165.1 hypothetical protein [Nesterenkonia massiliensis]
MTTRAAVDLLVGHQDSAAAGALSDLEDLFERLQSLSPDEARDVLLSALPVLVEEHGNVAAVYAEQWYADARAAQVSGRFQTRLGQNASREQVQRAVRRTAGHLYEGAPDAMLAALRGSVQKFVTDTGRDTIRRNIAADPERPRWAIIPSGSKSCAFCEMIASRGWMEGAPNLESGSFHPDCNCQVVPEWDKSRRNRIAGYDPDAMYGRYTAARDELAAEGTTPDAKLILSRMRDMHPDRYTDGHAVPAILREDVHGWPTDKLQPVTPGRWRHILKRHAPGGTAHDTFEGMTEYEIAKVIRAAAISPEAVLPHAVFSDIENRYIELDDVVYVVGTKVDGKLPQVRTAFPPNDESPIMEAWQSWKHEK